MQKLNLIIDAIQHHVLLYPKYIFILVLIGFGMQLNAQSYFTSKDKTEISGELDWIKPQKFESLEVNGAEMLRFLNTVPMEFTDEEDSKRIFLPYPDGRGFREFTIVESPIMEPELAAKFPQIKNYRGQGIDDPTAVMRLDYTPKGFHAIILGQEGTVYIDPYFSQKSSFYMSYFKKDFVSDQPFTCGVSEDEILESTGFHEHGSRSGGGLRSYRLAVSATGEYTVFHGGTVALGLAAINTTVARVNLVFERDLNIRFLLVANNNLIVYTNPAADPFSISTNYLFENQSNTDAVIGKK